MQLADSRQNDIASALAANPAAAAFFDKSQQGGIAQRAYLEQAECIQRRKRLGHVLLRFLAAARRRCRIQEGAGIGQESADSALAHDGAVEITAIDMVGKQVFCSHGCAPLI